MIYDQEYRDSVYTLMDAVMCGIVDVFEQAGVSVPERRLLLTHQAIHDCEQLTVSLVQLYLGPPGDQAAAPQRCDAPRTAVLLVELTRAIPTVGARGGAPSGEAINASTHQQLVDAYMLIEAGSRTLDQWGLGVMADVTPGEASGGYQAMTMNLIMAVP